MSATLAVSSSYGLVLKRRAVSGFGLMETVFSKGTRAPSHDHEEAFCCIALSGGCAEMYRNRRREIRPFTVDFLPARQMHSLDFRSFGVRAFSIDISPGWLERARCDYVRHLRINYASAELTKSDKPLAVIAADAGFADQSHFSRFFKRFTHMTPTEYRRTHTSR